MALETKAYRTFKQEMVEFIWKELDPYEPEIERTGQIPLDDLFPKLRRMRCFGLMVPEAYGGVGLSVSQYVQILAELAKIHGGIRVIVHVHNTTAKAVAQLGSEAQKRALLPKVATGEWSVAFGLTEPDAGTGRDLKTQMVRDGDHFVVNGRKHLITNSEFASHFMVFGHTDPTRGARGVSTLMVDRDTPGFTISDMPETMGCRGGQHGHLTFTNCRVPAANILGQEGEGLLQMTVALEVSRLFIAATSLGTAARALELSLDFAKRREQFGRPIVAFQAIEFMLADMAAEIMAATSMLYRVCWMAARGGMDGKTLHAQASAVKLVCSETAGRVIDRAVQIHGGRGYMREQPVERLYRELRVDRIWEGTSEIQRVVIGNELRKRGPDAYTAWPSA
jgi:alkylation response protein AidB-like acyl-CoA dehydrogenase